jgi:DNA-directed RNA polymerase subunit L
MDPRIEAQNTRNNKLYFRLAGTNVSIANALRRTIIADIPCVVMRAETTESPEIDITMNTSRLNNELIKQRLSCIPVHIQDTTFPVGDHRVEVDVTNTSDAIMIVTTQQFKIKNTATDSYLTEEQTRKVFPPDPITGDYISVVRLRPAQGKVGKEAIQFSCPLGISTASQNSAYAVACTCAYAATQDTAAADAAWNARNSEGAGKAGDGNSGADSIKKRDWDLLGAKRFTIPDSFDFVLESVGQFSTKELIRKGLDVLISKLRRYQDSTDLIQTSIQPAEGTMPNSYTITLMGEGYTIGKVLEYFLFASHIKGQSGSDNTLEYCGFTKPHPHIDKSIIRIAFADRKGKEDAASLIAGAARKGVAAFESLLLGFGEGE